MKQRCRCGASRVLLHTQKRQNTQKSCETLRTHRSVVGHGEHTEALTDAEITKSVDRRGEHRKRRQTQKTQLKRRQTQSTQKSIVRCRAHRKASSHMKKHRKVSSVAEKHRNILRHGNTEAADCKGAENWGSMPTSLWGSAPTFLWGVSLQEPLEPNPLEASLQEQLEMDPVEVSLQEPLELTRWRR